MREKDKKYERVRRMIESDRYGLIGGAKDMIKRDLEGLIGEYFALTSPVDLDIEGEENEFTIVMTCHGCRFKRFNILK